MAGNLLIVGAHGEALPASLLPAPAPVQREPEAFGISVADIARICHEANRAFQQVLSKTTGEPVSPAWDEAPGYMRESSIIGVTSLLNNPGLTPEDLHDLWSRALLADGWTYGPEKDEAKKTHNCLVPYHMLPQAQQFKDALFQAVADVFIPAPEEQQLPDHVLNAEAYSTEAEDEQASGD